jgi:hypothetical protein
MKQLLSEIRSHGVKIYRRMGALRRDSQWLKREERIS